MVIIHLSINYSINYFILFKDFVSIIALGARDYFHTTDEVPLCYTHKGGRRQVLQHSDPRTWSRFSELMGQAEI